MNLTWTCHICGRERPDASISVDKHDESSRHSLPPGTVTENIRYCNDNPYCANAAKTFSLRDRQRPAQ